MFETKQASQFNNEPKPKESNKDKNDAKKNLYGAMSLLLLILSVFFIIRIVDHLKNGHPSRISDFNTITVYGTGEVQAVPDIAKVSFSITNTAETVELAQDAVTKIEADVLSALKSQGVEDKDIKTTSSSFYPKYEYRYDAPQLECAGYGCPPNPGRNVIVGYEVSERIEVKVRNTDSVGEIIQELGTLGVSSLSGPNFSIDDEDILKIDARRIAIEDAKEKAKVLSKDLGVRLGKVVSFNEGGGYYPISYAREEMAMAMDSSAMNAAPSLPKGENTISSSVTIIYEIK